MCHSQPIVDLSLQLGLVGGSEEVDGLHVQLERQEVGEVEIGGGILSVETLRELPQLGRSGTEQSDRGSGVRALDVNTDSLEDGTNH